MIDPINRGSAGGQCRYVRKCISKFMDLLEELGHSLILKATGILEQPSSTSLLQSSF